MTSKFSKTVKLIRWVLENPQQVISAIESAYIKDQTSQFIKEHQSREIKLEN